MAVPSMNPAIPQRYIRWTVIACLATFTVACFTPASTVPNLSDTRDKTRLGVEHLVLGMFFGGGPHWLANPVGLAALVFFMRRWFKTAGGLSAVAVACAVTIPFSHQNDRFDVGYYLWLVCPMMLGASATIAGWFGEALARSWQVGNLPHE